MKKLVLILLLLAFLISYQGLKAQMITYSGPVEYTMEVIKTASGGGYDWNVSVNESQIINGSFYVTFTGGTAGMRSLSVFKLTSVEENIDFVNTVNNEGNEQKSSQPCYNDRLEFTHKATPGDARTRSISIISSRINTEKPVINGGQLMIRNDEYFLSLMGKMKMDITSETYSEETYSFLDTLIPPKSNSNSITYDFPIAIGAKKKLGNLNYLEGTRILDNTSSDNCNQCIPGELARMVHGNMTCSYISNITTSWMLLKRTEECDANVTYIKGDVKINGVPASEGQIKVGAGDVIETGEKSRIAFSLRNGSELYRLGSKSKLQLSDPCTNEIKPMSKGIAVFDFIRGKVLGIKLKTRYEREDFDSNEDYINYMVLNSWFHTAVAGVRGQLINPDPIFFASISQNCNYLYHQDDPEKIAIIEECSNIPENATAVFISFENGNVKNVSALKGVISIQDGEGIRKMDLPEGKTTNHWNDGTQMTEIFIIGR